MLGNEIIYSFFDIFKEYIKKNKPVNEEQYKLYYITAEVSANLLYIILKHLSATNNLTINNVINYITIEKLIEIRFSKSTDEISKKILDIYINNIIPNREHVWITNIIKEFIAYNRKIRL